MRDGGYDVGYRAVSCFWGTEPSSLVKLFLSDIRPSGTGRVLDLGCGEGKNAAAFAEAGYLVDAIDCSSAAIENGRKQFPIQRVNWTVGDVLSYSSPDDSYDIVVAYGLAHCLSDAEEVEHLVKLMRRLTKPSGYNILCTFNDRSHDLSAHPGFAPLLLPHSFFTMLYQDWTRITSTDDTIHETHPHNGIPHHHSVTRILAKKPNATPLST
ncbi:class I SAM-dependent methyltransferase [Microvirga guangxiensis]|uniref:Methyltransferase domain-containing protein n=1 Tax=Microvirga guangxiensis TaxID=549386 RepID=A0A1G5F5L0_9HYPH|nr:class I SAM-dependent methyltransferase [Microvirga guangxiensis]SCY34474.1 Methyltransferase domain-containing protein [Microvirga guangxiensis]